VARLLGEGSLAISLNVKNKIIQLNSKFIKRLRSDFQHIVLVFQEKPSYPNVKVLKKSKN
jgi:hypothetical protein